MPGTTDENSVLEVRRITKRFPGVLANDDVNLKLHRGQILALLGENGAGKSTLMNIIYGLYHPDEGEIRLKGERVTFASPREAIRSGIGMVHQHFQLIPVMTVAENVTLGEENSVARRPRGALDESSVAGWIRLIWGFLWRALIPALAVALGLLITQVSIQLSNVIATYLPQNLPLFAEDAFKKLPIRQKAEAILASHYAGNPLFVSALLWLPLLLGSLAAAAILVLGYRSARKTWRGKNRKHPVQGRKLAPLDTIIDAIIDLADTVSAMQDRGRAAARVRDISRQFNLEVDPDAYIEKLPVGIQQRVEIIKALYRDAEILILDEPTAVLTPQESEELFKIMQQLAREKNVSIIFITHKLKEVLRVADNIVVMRNGRVVGATTPVQATAESLAEMMVGREVALKVDKSYARPTNVVLAVEGLSAKDDRGSTVVDDIAFEVRAGEVLGIAGVQGNGQSELVEVLTGLRKASAGRFIINEQVCNNPDPRTITMLSTAHVPEDRHRFGMVKPFPVSDNLVLNRYFLHPFAIFPSINSLGPALAAYIGLFGVTIFVLASIWFGSVWPPILTALRPQNVRVRDNPGPFILSLVIAFIATLIGIFAAHFVASNLLNLGRRVLANINPAFGKPAPSGGLTVNKDAVLQNAEDLIKEFDIRTPSSEINAGNLSGGNQQKLVVAREFSRKPNLLIASQPTRGIDVGSIEFIHNRIIQQRDAGAAVLLVSAELDEIMALSDRIAVMYKGRIVDVVPGGGATREQLGLLMAGIRRDWTGPWRTVTESTVVETVT